MSSRRRNVHIFTVNRPAVRRVEAARGVPLGVNREIFDGDVGFFTRCKNGIGPFGSRTYGRIGNSSRTIGNEEDGILTVEITAVITGRIARL